MKDASGLPITDGFYTDSQVFYYYHVKKTPRGFMKKEASEKNYSQLNSSLALTMNRIIRQEELVNLILSVEKESENELEEEIHTGILGRMKPSQSQP